MKTIRFYPMCYRSLEEAKSARPSRILEMWAARNGLEITYQERIYYNRSNSTTLDSMGDVESYSNDVFWELFADVPDGIQVPDQQVISTASKDWLGYDDATVLRKSLTGEAI